MPNTYFNRSELNRQIKDLSDKLAMALQQAKKIGARLHAANLENARLGDELLHERDRSASFSRTVLRQAREIARLKAEIARLDDVVARVVSKEIKAEFGAKKSA